MWNNWIGQRIRRGNRRILLFGLCFCVAAAALLWLMRFALDNFFRGPFPLEVADLALIKDPDQLTRYFVTFEAPLRGPTPFQVKSKSGVVSAEYVLVEVEHRPLLVRVTPPHPENTFTGKIRFPDYQEQTKILAVLEKEKPGIKSFLLPYIVDAQPENFRVNVIMGLVLVGILAAVGFGLATWAVWRMGNPARQRLARSLKRFGTPHEVADTIAAETASAQPFRIGGITLVGRWVDCRSNILRVDDLIWIYKLVVRINGVPTYHIKMYDRHGFEVSVAMKDKHVDAVLTALSKLAPWVLTGYDAKLEDFWKNKRQVMIDAVAERRTEHQQKKAEKGQDDKTNVSEPPPKRS